MTTSFLENERYTSLGSNEKRKVFDQEMLGFVNDDERFKSLSPDEQRAALDKMWDVSNAPVEQDAASQHPINFRREPEPGLIDKFKRGAKSFVSAATGPGIDQMQLALSDIIKGDLPLEDSEYDKRQQAQMDEYFKSISEQRANAPSTQAGVSTPLSMATSGVSFATGLAASAPFGGGTPAGLVAGTAASGAATFAMMWKIGKYDALRQVRDVLLRDYTLTEEDWKNLQHNLDAEVSKAGFAEAGGEALSDALGYAIFKVPIGKLGKPLSALIGQKTAQRIVESTIGKLGLKASGTLAAELGGETATKVGQNTAMYEAEQKLPEGTKLTPEGYDPNAPLAQRAADAFAEVGPATAIQTLAVGGARGIVNYAGRRLARGGQANPTDTVPPSVSEEAAADPQVPDATTGPAPLPSVAERNQSIINSMFAPTQAERNQEIINSEMSDAEREVGKIKEPAVPIVLAKTVDDAVDAFEKEVSKPSERTVETPKIVPDAEVLPEIQSPPVEPVIARSMVDEPITDQFVDANKMVVAPKVEPVVQPPVETKPERVFKTERAAAESIKQRKIKDVEPMKVEGGYAIASVKPVEAPKIVSEAEVQPEAQTPPVESVSASAMAPEIVSEPVVQPEVKATPERVFKTEKGAKASIRQRKLEGYEPVQVEGGFKVAKKAKQVGQPQQTVAAETPKTEDSDITIEKQTDQPTASLVSRESTEKLESIKQMLEDQIATRKANGQPIKKEHIDKLAEVKEKLRGAEPEVDSVASNPVFGHPEATTSPRYANLIPFRVKDIESVDRFIDRTQKEVDDLQKKIGTAEAVATGKVKSSPKKMADAKKYLASGNHTEDATHLDMLRSETMPELSRLRKEVEKAKVKPSGSQTQKSDPQTDSRVADEPQSKPEPKPEKKQKAEPQKVKENVTETEATKPEPNKKYSTRKGTKTDITEEQVQRAFGKAATVTKTSDTTFDITTPSGKVALEVVDHIPIDEKAFEASYGRKATPEEIERGASGSYSDGKIQVSPVGDSFTIDHELIHWLMESGVLSFNDARAILRSAGIDGRTVTAENIGEYEEQIAAHIESVRMERAKPVGRAKEIIRKILDFVDGLVNMAGVRTARGVVKDIDSGAIFDGDKTERSNGEVRYSTRVKAQNDFNGGVIDTIKDYGQVLLPAKLTKVGKQDLNRIRDLILRTPAFFAKKIHAAKAIFDASQKRVDRFWNLLNEMENSKINGVDVNTFTQLDKVKKLSKEGYNAVGKYLTDSDKNDTGFSIKIGENDKWAVVNPKGATIKSFESRIEKGRDVGEDAAIEYMLDAEGDFLAEKGFTRNQILAVRAFRMSTNKGFDLSLSNLKRVLLLHEKSGTEMPEIKITGDDGKMKAITIRDAINLMGERRGKYFPRIRKPGTYILTAKKEGKDNILEKFSLLGGGLMNKRADELRRDGWTVETSKEQRVGEDVFQLNGDLIKTQQLLDAAIARVERGDFSDETLEAEMLHMITTAVTEQVAEVVRERGARVHMNRRSKEYWAGYEMDPKIAISSYIRGMAAGEAKREMTSRMMKALTGTEVTWDRYQDIAQYDGDYESWLNEREKEIDIDLVTKDMFDRINDPEWAEKIGNATLDLEQMLKTETDKAMIDVLKKDLSEKKQELYKRYNDFVKEQKIDNKEQPVAFEWAKAYIAENTRNQEAIDRIIGTLRGLAVGKFLAFRVLAAPLTNLTSLPTSTIATMKAAGIPYRKTYGLLSNAIVDYGKFRIGKLKGDAAKVYDYIHANGWDNAQYNSEAMSTLRSAVGKKYDWIIEWGMKTFSESERLNRAATIAATYSGLEAKYGDTKSFEELMQMANQVAKDAHGIYNKGDLPFIALGKHPAAHIARMFYVFKKFSHVYLQNMARMGLEQKDYGAVAHMLISPAILAGAGASVIVPIASTILKGFGYDEPEEEMYRKIGSVWGDSTERFARFGAAGAAGISLKGSLQMDIGDSLFGAPGSILKDSWDAMKYLSRGDISKGVEKALPTGLASPFKATREYTEGLTTKSNAPLFYGNEQVRPSLMEAFIRGASLNPVGIATIREKQSKEYKVKEKYRKWSTDIYAKAKRMKLKGRMDQEKMAELLGEITKYNEGAVRWGLSPITKKSIKKNIKRNFKASRFERKRSERNN